MLSDFVPNCISTPAPKTVLQGGRCLEAGNPLLLPRLASKESLSPSSPYLAA